MPAEQTKESFQKGRADDRIQTSLAETPPAPVDMAIALAKKTSEIKLLLAEKGELEHEVQQYETELKGLKAEMRKANQAKHFIEPKLAKAEDELEKRGGEADKLLEVNRELKTRAERWREEASDGRKEVEELTSVNARLLDKVESMARELEKRDGTITEFKKEMVGLVEKELRSKVLEAETERLTEEIEMMRGEMESLLEQQRELEVELFQDDGMGMRRMTEEEMEKSWASLEQEFQDSDPGRGDDGKSEIEVNELFTYSSSATQTQPTSHNMNKWRVSDIITVGRIPEAVEAVTRAVHHSILTPSNIFPEPSPLSLDAGQDEAGEGKHPGLTSSIAHSALHLFGLEKSSPSSDGNVVSKSKRDPQRDAQSVKKEDFMDRCFSIARWVILMFCVISWYQYCRTEKRLWTQANEDSRRTVLEWRDEQWFRPIWMSRVDFTAATLLKIDRLPVT